MIVETGIVTKTEDTTAKVVVQKRGACDGCNAKGTCATTPEGMEISALNPVKARVGQTVKVSLRPETYLKGTMLVYGLPLVLFIAGAMAGKNIGEKYMAGVNSDVVAAIAGFSALVASLLLVRIWSKKLESKTEYQPVIDEIIE